MINLSVCVQHHPSRADLLPLLLKRLGECEIIADPEPDAPRPSAWRTYKLALEGTPEQATHRLIIQDDALPCMGFRGFVEEAIAERPERLISFFLAAEPRRTAREARIAFDAGEGWVDFVMHDWVPSVATVWPVEMIEPFLRYCMKYPRHHLGDDSKIGDWVKAAKVTACATVPSLVEHPDVVPSLMGTHASMQRRPRRVALLPPPP